MFYLSAEQYCQGTVRFCVERDHLDIRSVRALLAQREPNGYVSNRLTYGSSRSC